MTQFLKGCNNGLTVFFVCYSKQCNLLKNPYPHLYTMSLPKRQQEQTRG